MSDDQTHPRRATYQENFLAALCRVVAAPSTEWPTVRIWKKKSLEKLIRDLHKCLSDSRPPLTNSELLSWLQRLGLLWPIATDEVQFYMLEMGACPESQINPYELMMAYEPTGTVCYFSALAFHSLTTQMPSQHHVAVLSRLTPSVEAAAAFEESQRAGSEVLEREINSEIDEGPRRSGRQSASPFGKLIFHHAQVPYYLTRRSIRLMPGVQTRYDGPRGRFRITNIEQTLLDTFHKPQSCGGPATIFEAWQEAINAGKLDEDRMIRHLQQMNYPSTCRRLGVMLKLIDYDAGVQMRSYLRTEREKVFSNSDISQISLFPGFNFGQVDSEWQVSMP